MNFLDWVIWFIVAIGVLVTVHEFGHYIVARSLGVKVLRFSIGFGKPLLTWRGGRDDTEYCIAAIPLGGYVKMLDEGEGDVPAHDLPRAFNRQPMPVRIAVVVAGPAFNFIFAVLAYWMVFVAGVSGMKPVIGAVTPNSPAAAAGLEAGQQIRTVDGDAVATWQGVVERVIDAALSRRPLALEIVDLPGGEPVAAASASLGPARSLTLPMDRISLDALAGGKFFSTLGIERLEPAWPAVIAEVNPGTPAESSGLQSGDEVRAVDGAEIGGWMDLVKIVQARPGQPLVLTVERSRERLSIGLTPAAVDGPGGKPIGRIGAVAKRPDGFEERFLGREVYAPGTALSKALVKTWDTVTLMFRMLWKMLTLEVSVKNLSGPLSIAQFASLSADQGAVRFVDFLAIVSVSLGVLNLLPIPMLDGGHLLYYAVEAVTRRPVSEALMFAGQRLGIALLFGLMGLAFYNDIVRLFG